MKEAGMSVKMLTADNCLNIDPSTEYLIPSEVEFIHNLDYLKDISSVTENTRLSLKRLFDGEVGTDVSTRLSSYVDPYMLAYSFREAEECLKSFRLILSEEAPDVVVVLHENSFWTKTLAYLCAEKDILCIAFQEGLLRHRDQETHRKQTTSAEYVRYLLVWSEESKRAYIDAGIDKEKLSVKLVIFGVILNIILNYFLIPLALSILLFFSFIPKENIYLDYVS